MTSKTARQAAAVKAGQVATLRRQQKKAKHAAKGQQLAAARKAAQQRCQQQADDNIDATQRSQSQEGPPSPRLERIQSKPELFTP
jgi:hypothetical protein